MSQPSQPESQPEPTTLPCLACLEKLDPRDREREICSCRGMAACTNTHCFGGWLYLCTTCRDTGKIDEVECGNCGDLLLATEAHTVTTAPGRYFCTPCADDRYHSTCRLTRRTWCLTRTWCPGPQICV